MMKGKVMNSFVHIKKFAKFVMVLHLATTNVNIYGIFKEHIL